MMMRDAHRTRIEVHPLVVAGRLRRTLLLADRPLANGVTAAAGTLARFEKRARVAKLAQLVGRAHPGKAGAENQHFSAWRRKSLERKCPGRFRYGDKAKGHHRLVGHRRARRTGEAFKEQSSCERHVSPRATDAPRHDESHQRRINAFAQGMTRFRDRRTGHAAVDRRIKIVVSGADAFTIAAFGRRIRSAASPRHDENMMAAHGVTRFVGCLDRSPQKCVDAANARRGCYGCASWICSSDPRPLGQPRLPPAACCSGGCRR